MKSLLFFACLAAAASSAWAEGAAVETGSGILQMLTGLVVVLAMLGVSLWLLKRISVPRGQAGGVMRIVTGTAVGPRERVVLLEIGSTWLVLGVAPGRISALAEVPRQEIPAAPAGEGEKDFSGWLKHIVERRNAPPH
jgi:flagellar protein FliO/FliZ